MDLPRAAGRSTLSVSRMKRVAIFGNAGGGKSTLARELAAITGLPLHALDKLRHRPGSGDVPYEEYLQAHTTLVNCDEWIIDGFGCIKSVWGRFEAADTLSAAQFRVTGCSGLAIVT